MKQKKYDDIKAGEKFRFKRRLYIASEDGEPVCLSDGSVPSYAALPNGTLVIPVKVKITVK